MISRSFSRACLQVTFVAAFAMARTTIAAASEADGPVPVRPPAYRIENVRLPTEMSPEASALAFAPSGRLFVANRHGDIWTMSPDRADWKKFAHGLHEPLGIYAVSDTEVYAAHKPELTRLVDQNGDLRADLYETFADDWPITDNWHEHTFGLARDREGNFFLSLGLTDVAGPVNTLWPRLPLDFTTFSHEAKLSLGPGPGSVVKITPQGKVIPWAYGFREPCGIAISPRGEVFITDQQGDYIGSSPLTHVEEGKFYGHPASAKWMPCDLDNRLPRDEALALLRSPESVVLPHGSMGGSPGEPVWDTTEGRFGPFAGQVLIGDFTKLISRIDLERVDGQWQGACFSFLRDAVGESIGQKGAGLTIAAGSEGKKYFREVAPLNGGPLRQGNMRMAFAPDGSLYVAQTTRGWGVGDGVQRIVWTGETPVDILSLRLTENGFKIRWTSPVRREAADSPSNYVVSRFRYAYHKHYGSPRVDLTDVKVISASANEAGDEVDLVLEELIPGFIYEFQLSDSLMSDGEPLRYPHAWYTLNRTLDGRRFEGKITSGSKPLGPGEKPRNPDPQLGLRVYNTFCVQCHRADGSGSGISGIGAADFTRPNGVLTRTDDDLKSRITRGIEGKTMPPFGYVLTEQQIDDVLAYLRHQFGQK